MAITNTKYVGRAYTVSMENTLGGGTYTVIGGVRSKSMTINNEVIDISDGDDDTWKKLLEGGIRSLAASVSGLVSNNSAFEQLQDKVFAGNIWRLKFAYADGDTMIGLFQITSLEQHGDYNGAQMFSASFASADTPVLTAA